ncbi:hypothetical protein ACQ4PT_003191 [Festuca glaucescens]
MREILLKLPTRDAVRSSCLSKQLCDIVKDPSFSEHHAVEHAVPSPGGGAEALLVTVNRVPGGCLDPNIYSVTSSKHMCRLTDSIAMSHVATNVCNGFICFGPAAYGVAPAVLCNPATGETLALPAAPPIEDDMDRYLFLLGFSPPNGEYKLFRLSFRETGYNGDHYVDVCTLGDGRGWRELPHLLPFRQFHSVPPVFLDGKLYLVTNSMQFAGKPEGILVLDVASEAQCTYRPPEEEYVDLGHNALVDVLELHGQFCLVVNYVLVSPDRPMVEFWVMPRLGRLDSKNHKRLNWELRYTFYVDVDHVSRKATASRYAWERQYRDQPRAAWLDEDKMLCYMLRDCLYKYNTRWHSRPAGILEWHQKVHLPTTPSPSNRRWNVYGGYRPSLLSPLAFALPSSQDDEENNGRFEHDMLHALRPQKSKLHHTNDRTSDGPGCKRICRRTNFQRRQ